MRRRMMKALRTAASLAALFVLAGLHSKPGRGGNRRNRGGQRPKSGNVGGQIKSDADQARQNRPGNGSPPSGRRPDGSTPSNPHSRDYGSEVPYNRGRLAEAAFNYRREHGVSPGQNVAVAELNNGDLVYGVSQGSTKKQKYHSEDHILDQVDDPTDIKSIYSERQPCSPCESNLTPPLTGEQVSYSVSWYDDKNLNSVSNDMLKEKIDNAYRGR